MRRVFSFTSSRLARAVSWAAILLLVLWVLQPALTTSSIPLGLRILTAGIAVAAMGWPAIALTAIATLVPLAHSIARTTMGMNWEATPFNFPEALVLAFFAGYLIGRRHEFVDSDDADPIGLPSRCFIAAVTLSLVGQLRVLQVWHDYPLAYAAGLVRFLGGGYLTTIPDPRPWVDGRGYLAVPALLIEGIALLRCTRRLCANRPGTAYALAAGLAISGFAAALLAFKQPVDMALSTGRPILEAIAAQRWSSPAIPSLNTAGPYFLLVAFIAAGLALEAGWWRALGVPAAVAALGAMWLTQTRSAIVAGLAVISSAAVWFLATRHLGHWPLKRIGLLTATVAVVVGIGIVVFNPLQILAQGSARSLQFRLLFADAAVRMFASAPLIGVGVGQYESYYRDFVSPELLRLDPRVNNAHNYLLWMGAELGVGGVGLFLWLMGVLVRGWFRNVAGARDGRPLRMATLLGLLAFLATWSIGQPIGIATAAFAFWMAAGFASASDHAELVERRQPLTRRGQHALAALIVILAAAMPVRTARAVSQIDLSRVRYGFYQSAVSPDDVHFTWGGPRIRFYQRSTIPGLDIQLGSFLETMPDGASVVVSVDGHFVQTVELNPQQWTTIRIWPAPDAWRVSAFWRIDLGVQPRGSHTANVPDTGRRIAIGPISPVALWETSR